MPVVASASRLNGTQNHEPKSFLRDGKFFGISASAATKDTYYAEMLKYSITE